MLEKKELEVQLVNKQCIDSGRISIRCAPAITDVVYCDFKASASGLPKKKLGGNTGTAHSHLAVLSLLDFCNFFILDTHTLADPYFVIKTPINITEIKSIQCRFILLFPLTRSIYVHLQL